MAVMDRIRQLFNKGVGSQPITERLPFIRILGSEKTYGKPHPQDYASMIRAYSSWAYACAWKNASSVAKCELCLYTMGYDNKKEKKEKKEVENHPFLDLMKSVNPFSNGYELKAVTTLNLELTGNAYWYIPKGILGIPAMIWNIPSHWVKIVPSETEFISGYVVTVPGKATPIPFDETEIIHFRYPSPSDLFYGQGPLWAARLGVDLNTEIRTWGINYFLNNAQPSGILTTEMSLTESQYNRLRDQWNEKYRGVKNAGKMAFLENGLKYQQMGSNVRDARFEFVSEEIRNEICACFGVPASKLGLEAHDNRATAEASDYTYQSETIVPKLTLIQEKINEKLVSLYDPRLFSEFENIVPEDKDFLLKERQINLTTGFSSIDELRLEQGLDPYDLPETEVPLIPFGLNPAGTPKPEPSIMPLPAGKTAVHTKDAKWETFVTVTTPNEKRMEGMMRRYFQRQHGEVIKNLRGLKSMKDITLNLIFNPDEETKNLKAQSKPYIKASYISGVELAKKDAPGIDFSLFEPKILTAVENRVRFFADKTNQTTGELINQQLLDVQLQEGLSQGETINELAARIDKVFNYREDFSSIRTARTEVIGATNEGLLASYKEAGFKNKEWITAGDERVRDSHVALDGKVVHIGEHFISGDGSSLMFPGDRSSGASASDVINCRCRINAVL